MTKSQRDSYLEAETNASYIIPKNGPLILRQPTSHPVPPFPCSPVCLSSGWQNSVREKA